LERALTRRADATEKPEDLLKMGPTSEEREHEVASRAELEADEKWKG